MGRFETKSTRVIAHLSHPPIGADVLALGKQGPSLRLHLFTPPASSLTMVSVALDRGPSTTPGLGLGALSCGSTVSLGSASVSDPIGTVKVALVAPAPKVSGHRAECRGRPGRDAGWAPGRRNPCGATLAPCGRLV